MVWEQKVAVIAMVTLEREGGKVNKSSILSTIEKNVAIIPGNTGMSPMCLIRILSSKLVVTIRLSCFPLKNLHLWILLGAVCTLILRADLYFFFQVKCHRYWPESEDQPLVFSGR